VLSLSINPLRDIHAFFTPLPLFVVSNGEKMPYLGPNTCFCLRNVVKKSDHFFGAALQPKDTSGGCQGVVPPSVWGGLKGAAVPLIAKKILDL
jgi:hypothetical protein